MDLNETLELPNYDLLDIALGGAEAEIPVSELHGFLTAGFCGGIEPTKATWLNFVLGKKKLPANLKKELTRQLSQLFDYTQALLASPDYDFNLLLPDDEASLRIRSEALCVWCQGFITGMATTHIKIDYTADSDLSAAIELIEQTATIPYDYVTDNEDEESAFHEVLECLRVSVILIYNELRDAAEESEYQTKH